MSDELKSKDGATIKVGDQVSAPYRGGQHIGETGSMLKEDRVEDTVTDEKEASKIEAKGAKHPPFVAFHDQNDKKVAHKPNTLTDLSKKEE